jgi:two-component system C4-dicarboxylate transport response regulator DctD
MSGTKTQTGCVLFVDDETDLREAAAQTLALEEIDAHLCAGAAEALPHLDRDFPGILVTDIRMPGTDGVALMRAALERDAELPVILVTGHGDVDLAVQSMREGAYDFIEKPYAPARLIESVRRALDKRRLTLENRALRAAVAAPDPEADPIAARLLGQSAAMRTLRQQLRAVAATEADVLIEGATGTGKELAARALHEAGDRAARPFVQINCAALPADLIESELFGHESGAFPGATRARYGRFEHARGGTVFLDEIDSLPLPLQAKLLHVVQNREVTRLGSNEALPLDLRFVAASKRDLGAAAAEGSFRADLLYRLNVVTIRMPGLDERREDIPLSLPQASDRALPARRPPGARGVDADAGGDIAARDWPGHVRELRNAAERVALGLDIGALAMAPSGATLSDRMAAHEKALIAAALAAHSGSVKATYEALGLSRKALYEKMQKHGLDRADYRRD